MYISKSTVLMCIYQTTIKSNKKPYQFFLGWIWLCSAPVNVPVQDASPPVLVGILQDMCSNLPELLALTRLLKGCSHTESPAFPESYTNWSSSQWKMLLCLYVKKCPTCFLNYGIICISYDWDDDYFRSYC